MTQASETHQGGCLCGAVRYEILAAPNWSGHCHCRSCQMALGAAFATWAKVAAEDFHVLQGGIKLCETSPGVRRGFCENCGTSLTYDAKVEVDGQDWSGDAWFAGNTLDDPSILKPETHVYVSHRQPWIKLADDLPTFDEF